jgi:predicted Na+-dependent transporter
MAVDILRYLGSTLLFFLVFGMSATVDVKSLRAQLKNTKAVGIGLLLQFVLLPLTGFITVKLFRFDHASGLILLVVTSSPGGSYSNWWCSMFNADLALSVTLTAISTCLSVVLLPFNLLLYSRLAYRDDLADIVDWGSLAVAVLLVICAVSCGLLSSAIMKSHTFNLRANRLGNAAGITLVVFSAILSSSDKNSRIWNRDAQFYVGVAIPSFIALLLGNLITRLLKLPHVEVVTISIESCYQNVGIAMSVALATFYGENLARAVAIPFYYGAVQALLTLVYSITAWKMGWTKAPANVPFWVMICTSYEILCLEMEDGSPQDVDDFVYVEGNTEKQSSNSNIMSNSTGRLYEAEEILEKQVAQMELT